MAYPVSHSSQILQNELSGRSTCAIPSPGSVVDSGSEHFISMLRPPAGSLLELLEAPVSVPHMTPSGQVKLEVPPFSSFKMKILQ